MKGNVIKNKIKTSKPKILKSDKQTKTFNR